ncbi:hypothetical protein E2562_019575 [Oryza meyeriana var. granulata]|uniref:DUF834 domain-containing protein n=1 Tax=Oryza meyeriana var. granulata TaxID=110450 RepID=A0A6G1BYF4_9ORYZ|nr:hypothetical protein E2562_019575 [Oryza meyeriana var. granulata]
MSYQAEETHRRPTRHALRRGNAVGPMGQHLGTGAPVPGPWRSSMAEGTRATAGGGVTTTAARQMTAMCQRGEGRGQRHWETVGAGAGGMGCRRRRIEREEIGALAGLGAHPW